jgi:uncharacterized membrane protein
MIASLEAIYLSTFVMISRNRADARRQVVANLSGGRCGKGTTSRTRSS